jgi:molybdenum cofactor guanylyltransferase
MYSAAILAGGRATRFGGRDKSALVVDGRTIRDRQIEMLASIAGEILIAGGNVAENRAARHEGARRITPRLIPDIVTDSGPMGGVHAALTAAAGDALLVLACDMPFVTAAFAAHLLGFAAGAELVIPRTEHGYHPLCAVYTRACLDPLTRHLAARDLKMISLLEDVRVRVVESDEIDRFGDRNRLLANVNTPADFDGLWALHGHER